MRNGLSGRLALDGSALIELILSTPKGRVLREALRDGSSDAHTTELGIIELRYILCRRYGAKESENRVAKLLSSGYIRVEATLPLVENASIYKCERAISMADCLCLSLAHRLSCRAVFARREEDLVREMDRRPFDVDVLFLEDLK